MTKLNEIIAWLSEVAAAAGQTGKLADDRLRSLFADDDKKQAFQALAKSAGRSAQEIRSNLQPVITFDAVTSLKEFFENVASSMIEAQKQLDVYSVNYSKEAAVAKVPAAVYAIPNVHAELRFGFTNLAAKGFNVVLFSTKSQKEEYSESSVSFDLVATAVPPKEARLPEGMPSAVVAGLRRDNILDKVIERMPAELQDPLIKNRPLAAVFEFDGVDPVPFLVLWPGKSPARNAAADSWYFFAAAVLQGESLTKEIFHFASGLQGEGVLVIPTDSALDELAKNPAEAAVQLKRLVVNLGDVLMNICFSVNSQSFPQKK
jgi:hypothetical protein